MDRDRFMSLYNAVKLEEIRSFMRNNDPYGFFFTLSDEPYPDTYFDFPNLFTKTQQ